jgi:hypothetical protein
LADAGAATLIKYPVCPNSTLQLDPADRSLNFTTSASVYFRADHCMLFLTKIWQEPAPIDSARSSARCTPPAVEQCAPNIIASLYRSAASGTAAFKPPG